MTTNVQAASAQIFQFPLRGRFAFAARGDNKTADVKSTQAARVAVSSGWYHDAAIQEAEQSRN